MLGIIQDQNAYAYYGRVNTVSEETSDGNSISVVRMGSWQVEKTLYKHSALAPNRQADLLRRQGQEDDHLEPGQIKTCLHHKH